MGGRTAVGGASSYSTGGGGTVLEHLYGAVLLSHLFTGTPVPALGDHVTPTEIRFQAKAIDDVDDIHVTGLAPTGARHHLSIGVRRRPKLVASDDDSVRLIGSYLATTAAHWALLRSRRWSLALAVASSSVPAHQLAELAVAAAASGSNAQFRARMTEPGRRPSKSALGRLDQLDGLVVAALQRGAPDGGVCATELTWRLLSRLSLVELRLEGAQGEDRSHAVGRLQRVTPSGTAAEGDALFSRLVEKAGAYAPAGAVVTRESLLADLRGLPCVLDGGTAGAERPSGDAPRAVGKGPRPAGPRRAPTQRPRPPRELWPPRQRVLPEAEQPVVCENTLVVRHGYRMSAFDAGTGKALWTASTARLGRPAVGGGAVYIADREQYPFPRDLRTGDKKSVLPGRIVDGLAVYDRGTLYAPDARGYLHAIDTASRTRLWTAPTGGPIAVPVRIIADTLLAVVSTRARPGIEAAALEPGQVLALDTDTGEPRWRQPAPVPGIHQWTVTEKGVYLFHRGGPAGNCLTALDTRHGTRLWDYPLADPPAAVPVADDHAVYLTGQKGTVHAIDAATGTEKWTGRAGTRITAPLVVAHDRVVVASHTPGRITVFDTRTGKHAWPKPGSGAGAFVSTPCVVGDFVWAANRSGNLHAWNLESGKPLTIRYHDALWDPDLQGHPTAVDGVLYFVTRRGDLHALCLG